MQFRPPNHLRIFWLSLLLVCATFAQRSFAHGDLHEQIAALGARIEAEPSSAELFLQRAELLRLHGDWPAALADCQTAENLKPNLIFSQFCRGKILFDAERFDEALAALNRFLSVEQRHSEGFLQRARVLMKLEKFKEAAKNFSEAIQLSKVPEPDFYIEYAAALKSSGNLKAAVTGLDEGIARLGPIVSLESPAIELELALRHYDAALHRVGLLSEQMQRKETWLLQRAEILEKAGRLSEAKAAYSETAQALVRLPARHRQSQSTQELETKLAAAWQRLN